MMQQIIYETRPDFIVETGTFKGGSALYWAYTLNGMGLGLAVCADILHEHKATIIVPDIERPGATFRITFPCPPPLS